MGGEQNDRNRRKHVSQFSTPNSSHSAEFFILPGKLHRPLKIYRRLTSTIKFSTFEPLASLLHHTQKPPATSGGFSLIYGAHCCQATVATTLAHLALAVLFQTEPRPRYKPISLAVNKEAIKLISLCQFVYFTSQLNVFACNSTGIMSSQVNRDTVIDVKPFWMMPSSFCQ